MTHHFVMTSSLHIKILKIDNFRDFSCDIDSNSRIDVFRVVISIIINQCYPRRPKGASGGHKVSASRAAQASEARLLLLYSIIYHIRILLLYSSIICHIRIFFLYGILYNIRIYTTYIKIYFHGPDSILI